MSTGAVLQAPPGAGKTTRVPLALLEEPWLSGGRIVMLEPRRLAARAAARRLASSLGEPVGATVGYRMRLDTRIGPATRLEVVTEGVLTRMLQQDPTLEGVGLLIFDEFHERSLHADLGLALALHAQRLVRPELRILVMSATLDVAPVARLLDDVPVIASAGREFPVAVHYLPEPLAGRDSRLIEARLIATIQRAIRDNEGDLLVFLPGAAEIHRVEGRLRETLDTPNIAIAPLHGSLSGDAQDLAIAPSPMGHRKIVLATSIAETSLTIEGVRVVVDSGLSRVPRFSPRTGLTRLETVRVNRASAEQRRGRAGRVAPGACYRLWTEIEHAQLLPRGTPEILEADLAPLALELAIAGIAAPLELSWLDPPPNASLGQAHELLRELEAVGEHGRVTEHGKAVARLPVHPRLAHMIVRAIPLHMALTACRVAATLGERDMLRGDAARPEADLRTRLDLLTRTTHDARADHATLRRIRTEAEHLAQGLRVGREQNMSDAGLLIAFAYPDRIAQRRLGGKRGRYLLRNGRGAAVDEHDPLGDEEYLAVASVDDRQGESRIFLAAPLARADIDKHFDSQIIETQLVEWDAATETVIARRQSRLGALVLSDEPLRDVDSDDVARALTAALVGAGLDALPWSESARRLRERLAFLHFVDSSWPDVSDAALAESIHEWLAPRIIGMRRLRDVAQLDLGQALLDRLSWNQRASLDELAPTHFVAPSGSRLPIDYSDPSAPVLAVRLQEMFGLAETPRIAKGRMPLTLHLLSPAHRPLQVTRDLAGFWRTSYFDVRREMRGRYPKHDWPEEPMKAKPTARAKRGRE